jgi:hypothetical protein
MAKKVHSDVKAAVSLIIRENLSALKDVFRNHGHSESKPLPENQEAIRENDGKENSEARPERMPQENIKKG